MAAARQAQPDHPTSPAEGSGFADVLCAVDGTPESLAAVEQAAALAGPSGHLTLLAVTSFDAESAYRGPAIGPAQAKRLLDSAVRIAEQAHVPVTVEVDPAGPPARVVLDWSASRNLLAMGAPATSWFGGMFAGGVAVAAESSFTTPLLVARSKVAEVPFAQRILVASDGLEGSDELVESAARLARSRQADLVLVHATGSSSKARRRRVEEQAQKLNLPGDRLTEIRVQAGSARAVIVEAAAATQASLILMSSRRLKGLRAIGSVSRRVVHQGHCSVLLMPPEQLLRR